MEREQGVPADEHDAEDGLWPGAGDQRDDQEHRRGRERSVEEHTARGRVPCHTSTCFGGHGKDRAVEQEVVPPIRAHALDGGIAREPICRRAVGALVVDRGDSAVGPVVVRIPGQQQGPCERDQLHRHGDDDRRSPARRSELAGEQNAGDVPDEREHHRHDQDGLPRSGWHERRALRAFRGARGGDDDCDGPANDDSGNGEGRRPAQRRSLFDSMSNHIAKSVNWLPEIRSSATRTIVGVVISFPARRRMASIAPSSRPASVIRIPSA